MFNVAERNAWVIDENLDHYDNERMKTTKLMTLLFLISLGFLQTSVWAKDECKQLKSCAEFVGLMTGAKYDLGKFEKKSLRSDPNLKMTNGNAEQVFLYILEQNNLFRVATQDNHFRIVDKKEFNLFQFPKVETANIRHTLDFVTYEYVVKDPTLKLMLMGIAKKQISKNGRVLENIGESKLTLVDNGANVLKIVGMLNELDR